MKKTTGTKTSKIKTRKSKPILELLTPETETTYWERKKSQEKRLATWLTLNFIYYFKFNETQHVLLCACIFFRCNRRNRKKR